MKYFYYALGILLLAFQNPLKAQEVLTGTDANQIIGKSEMIRTSKYGNFPTYIKFQPGEEPSTIDYINNLKSNLKLESQLDLVLVSEKTDDLGFTHYNFKETYNGNTIEFTTWKIHSKLGKVYSQNGFIFQSLEVASSATISSTQAIKNATDHIDAAIYKWQVPAEESFIKMSNEDPEASYYPTPTLVYAPKGDDYSADVYHLSYKMNIYAHEPLSRQFIYVDAITGEINKTVEQIHHTDALGTATTGYSGVRPMTTDSLSPNSFRLRETGRGNGIETYNMQSGTSYGNAIDFTDTDNNWNNANATFDQYAADAHWGSEMTYDYFLQDHNRNSIDDNGFKLKSYIHFDNAYNNAFWDGAQMTYGDGNGNPLTSIDIAGHEITHGLTSNTADLVYQAESGALNESFSDIFAVAIEKHGRPNNWNWTLGEDLGTPIRSLINPNSMGDPDTYFGNNWASLSGADQGGVHTNSSVQNYWFYLLSMGGTGTNDNGDAYTVAGIGVDDAADVAYRNLTVYLDQNSNFSDARFFAIQSAIDLYGACTPNVGSVSDAWYAVGVGSAYVPYVFADFNVVNPISCAPPHAVDFNYTGANGTTFAWNFGDGSTSTSRSPSHTYTTFGAYTVTLNITGGTCGIDDTVKTNYIMINDTLPCIITMPTSGTADNQTACNGKLFDSGGPANAYGDNENSIMTIAPTGAQTVSLSFANFDIEAGTGSSCNYDYLNIYDGSNSNAPLIGKYCNNNIPTSITSTGGSITIAFSSDGGVTGTGFELDWQCNIATAAPVADFSNNINSTCGPDIEFTDISNNGPISWLWSFGDGQTSTLRHPVHHYQSSGTYDVALTSSNSFGNSTETKIGLITVTYTGTASAVSSMVCPNHSDTLIASSGGINYWYDSQYSGASIFQGDTFITPPLAISTMYYLDKSVATPSVFVGPADNNFGTGGNFAGDQNLIFDVSTPIILQKVTVYASGSGVRNIELRGSNGALLDTANVYLSDGQSVINLNFEIQTGSDYTLGVAPGSQPNLYRNNAGASFPYSIANKVSITGSSASAGFYYFFYNWEVKDITCSSPRIEIEALISECLSVEENSLDNNLSIFPNPAQNAFNIQLDEFKPGQNTLVTIVNATGQQVYVTEITSEQTSINSSRWAKGVYLVKVTFNDKYSIQRVVIE